MIKWIVISVILLLVNIGIRPMVMDSHQFLLNDGLAVAQLNDSDATVIALKASNRTSNMIDWGFSLGSITILGIGLYSDRKKLLDLLNQA